MMLRNQNRYLDLLHVDVVRHTRERREATDKSITCDGFFFEHGNRFYALGSEGGSMYVILNGKLLLYDARLQTHLVESPECNTFTASHRSRTVCRVTYSPVRASGWIPNEDDECLDGFLWLHNVLQDPERRSLMIRNKEQHG